MTNDKLKPNSGFTDEVGAIMGTYIMDMDRVLVGDGSDDMANGPGATAIHKYRLGLDAQDGLPRFRIKLDEDTAKNAIGFIRDDEAAIRKFGQSVTLYNQTRMDWGAVHHKPGDTGKGDSFQTMVRESAQLQSTVTDELIQGDLKNTEKRIRTMELLTAPLDNLNPVLGISAGGIDIPLGELINDGIVGVGKDAAGEHLLQQALREANEKDERATCMVKLQAVYAAVRAIPDDPSLPDWPADQNGRLKAPSELTDREIRDLREDIGNSQDLTGTASATVEDAWKTVDDRYKDR
jgi:hypothetical protein